MYIELKTGYSHNGPAWIGRVQFSKTGRTIYYRGRSFRSLKGGWRFHGNYYDVETGEEYWISGPKINKQNRHWAGSGPVTIDADAREEYEQLISSKRASKKD